MPFDNSNSSIDIILKARVEGMEQVKSFQGNVSSLDSQIKSLDATLQRHAAILGGNNSALAANTEATSINTTATNTLAVSTDALASATGSSTTATQGHTGATQGLTGAHRQLTTEIIAASSAIRLFEGAIPIRAVERFAVSVLGLGPLLQLAFPLIGLLAIGELIDRTVEKFDPLVKAEKALQEQTKKLDSEYASLGKRLESLNIAEITDKFGKVAGAKLAAFYSDSNLADDKARIQYLSHLIDETKYKLAEGKFTSSVPGYLGAFISQHTEGAAKDDIIHAEREKAALENKVTIDSRESAKHLADASKEASREANAAAAQEATALAAALKGASQAIIRLEGKPLGIIDTVLRQKQMDVDQINTSFGSLANKNDRMKAGGFIEALDPAADANITLQLNKAAEAQRHATFPFGGGPSSAGSEFQRSRDEDQSKQNSSVDATAKIIASMFEKVVRDTQNTIRHQDVPIIAGIRAAGNQQAQLAGLSNPGDDLHNLEQGLSIRLHAAEIELQIKQAHADVYDIVRETSTYEDEKQRAIFEMVKARIEFQNRQLSEIKNAAGSLFDDLTSKGAKGIGDFFTSQVKNIGKTIFENTAGVAFQSETGQGIAGKLSGLVGNQRDSSGELSTMGKIFQGTIFGDKGTKNAPIDLNTKASQLNTDAVTNLTATLVSGTNGTSTGGNGSLGNGSIIGTLASTAGLAGIGKSSSYTGLSGLLGGFKSTGDLQGILTGVGGNGGATSLSTSERVGGAVGTAGAVAAGVFKGISDFSKGGLKGMASGASDVLGTAALLTGGPTNPVGLALTLAAAGAGIIGMFGGDPRKARQTEEDKYVHNNMSDLALTNPTQTQTYDVSGAGSDYNSSGRSRAFGNTTNITMTVHAMDSQSILDRSSDISDAVIKGLNSGHGIASQIQSLVA